METVKLIDQKKRYFVSTSGSIWFTGLLGGPLAGIYLLYNNYKALNKPSEAKRILLIGMSLAVVLVTLLSLFEPISTESASIGTPMAGMIIFVIDTIYKDKQKSEILELLRNDQKSYPLWRLLVIIVASLAATLALAISIGFLTSISLNGII